MSQSAALGFARFEVLTLELTLERIEPRAERVPPASATPDPACPAPSTRLALVS